MRIVFFGSPATALPSLAKLLKGGHGVELVVCQPDKPFGRGKKLKPCLVKSFALDRGLSSYEPERIRKDPAALEKIRAVGPDIIVVVAYGQIIPASIIDLPKHKSINVHFSLLPKYRGASPVQWAILNGEEKTGVTIFRLNEKMDEGDILTSEAVPILPRENTLNLETRLSHIGAELLHRTLACLDRIRPIGQDHTLATYAPKLKKEDGQIDWNQDAEIVDRKVRAMTAWPSAYTFLHGRRLIIQEGQPSFEKADQDSPSRITSIEKYGILVCCRDRSLYLIQTLQPENKKSMGGYSFSLGGNVKTGDKLG
ncbi:MAG: methionyl-tRNA formyltransferase [Candidatus Aminicenantes bacterium]|nr:methionyl-tRNA formyltransferase [Candidatus Aminicenantes bacterium]